VKLTPETLTCHAGHSLDAPSLRYVRELRATLAELGDWMRERTGPNDGTLDMLTRAHALLNTEGTP
jgi:hypothetical protein